jgi:MoaA/NifB/PqqE/SkfB family radical SAM enzyme
MKESYFNLYKSDEKICLLYTLKCNINCGHCMTNSNLSREEKMTYEVAADIIQSAAQNNRKVVMFSGGECLIYFDEIAQLTELASAQGLDVIIETNGLWAETPAIADEKIALLKKKGLKVLFVSHDYFHSHFVSYDNIKNIVKAATELGIAYEVMYNNSSNEEADKVIKSNLIADGFVFFEETLMPAGRARELFDGSKKRPYRDFKYCDNFATTFIPNGDAFACCCLTDDNSALKQTPIFLGNRNQVSLAQIYKKEREDSFAQIIANKNLLSNYLAFISGRGLSYEDKKFATICELCISLASEEQFPHLLSDFMEWQNTAETKAGL